MIYSNETRIAMLEHRVRILKSRGEMERGHLIAKLEREIRSLKGEN